jgi:hypothetical protein
MIASKMPSFWTIATLALVAISAICVVMENRRNNRKDIDKIGLMAAFSAGLAFKGV